MGMKLAAYYDIAKEKNGVRGQVRLAMITCMALRKAIEAPDSLANIRIFEDAIKKI